MFLRAALSAALLSGGGAARARIAARSASAAAAATATADDELSALSARLGVALPRERLEEALTHPSYLSGAVPSHGRLEFLGDRVLSFFITERLVSAYPNLGQEALNDAHALFVSNRNLAKVAYNLGLVKAIRWTPISDDKEVSGLAKVSADCVEAIIGAIYLEQGPKAARAFVETHVWSRFSDIESAVEVEHPRIQLTTLMKQKLEALPSFKILSEVGRNTHAPVFKVGVFSGDKLLAEGKGRSIKAAENDAAARALKAHYGIANPNVELASDQLQA